MSAPSSTHRTIAHENRPSNDRHRLRIVGAGLGRTGTDALKIALEALLGGSCYDVSELLPRAGDLAVWRAALWKEPVDWKLLLDGYTATIGWPAASFWNEILAAHAGAFVLLSSRDPDEWWTSIERTVVPLLMHADPAAGDAFNARRELLRALLRSRLTPDWLDREAATKAYERHNARVRAEVPPAQLIDWHAGDGWGPICAALELPVPDLEFPREDSVADFRAKLAGGPGDA